ncbi:MAG: HEAT repeat domain-containing protein [Planctomycetota bacterium]|nr:HEAT repeat domain-containing protein [Planctomycetota bacterium]
MTWLLPCALGLLLAGCTPQEDEPPPPPKPLTSLDAMINPKDKGKGNPDRDVSPEELHARQLAKLKDSQEKGLKAYEEQLKKRKKQEERKKKDEKGTGEGKGMLVLPKGTTRVMQVEPPKHGDPKDMVAVAKNDGGAAAQIVELPNPNQPKSSSLGSTQRSTAEMRSALSAVDELQRQQPKEFTPARPERHDTMSNRVQQVMALRRLETAADAEGKEPEPSERKAEVVDLGDTKTATPAPNGYKGEPPGAAEDARKRGDTGTDDEADAFTPEESKAALEEQYRTGLQSRDVVAREASFQYAGMERREDAIPYLIEELKQNNVLASFAAQCLAAIGRLREDVEAILVRGLGSREAAVRQTCAQALGAMRSNRAVQPLVEGLKTEKSYQVRCALLDALGVIGERSALPAMKSKLEQRDEIEFVKSHAALALARMGDPSGRAHLIANLDSQVPAYQVTGLLGLAQLDDPQIAGYLNSALESGYDEVWTTAVYLFPRLGPTRALPILRSRLESPAEVMRRRAALTMGFLGSDEAMSYLERAVRFGSLQERAMGCELLGRLARNDKIPLLIEKLHDPHTSVRQTAAVALVRLNATSAVPALTEATRAMPHAGDLPPGLRGAGPDALERVVMLSCVRILRGEKEDLIITTLPNQRDNTWPEVDRVLGEKQIELVKLYQFVDVIADHDRPLGVVLRSPDGKEVLYRQGETVASGFKVREIGLAAGAKDKPKSPPYVILMRGDERVILIAGRPAEVDVKDKQR